MSLSDFQSITGLVRAYLRSESSWVSATNSDGEDITGAIDATGTANATLANSPSAPEYNTNPAGGLAQPTMLHVNGENGLALGSLNFNVDTTWTIGVCVRADSFGTFRNIFSSQGGASEGSFYADSGGTLRYEEATTESFVTLSVDTVYRLILTSAADAYRAYVNGTLVWTSTMVPAVGPSNVETAAYGGSGAGWDGDWWAIVAYSTTVSGSDITTLDTALQDEAEGASVVLLPRSYIRPDQIHDSEGYKEFQYNPDGTISILNIWANVSKATFLRRKTFTYTGDLLTSIFIEYADGTSVTKTLTYDSEGLLETSSS